MPRKTYGPEQIINKLREAEVLLTRETLLESSQRRLGSVTSLITAGEKNTAVCV